MLQQGLVLLFLCCGFASPLLSALATSASPWLDSPAWSRRLFPVFTGLTPLALSLNETQDPAADRILPSYMESLSRSFASVLSSVCQNNSIPLSSEFEVFPSYDDNNGFYTFVFARYREVPNADWQFLPPVDGDIATMMIPAPIFDTSPIFPVSLSAIANASSIFDAAFQLDDLYAQPLFGNCIWTKSDGTILFAWLNPENISLVADMKVIAQQQDLACVVVPPP
jgi:hypothetical protein